MEKDSEILSKVIIYFIVILAGLVTLYPFFYVLSNSLSSPAEVVKKTVWLLPKRFSLISYQEFFKDRDAIYSFYNTIWYTVVGTAVNILLTIMAAYALSVRKFFLRRPVSLMLVITMFVSGGIIPTYVVVNALGLYNTRMAMVLPTAISAYNLIVARTYFESLPEALAESAKLDGANDIVVLFRIIAPIAKPIIAVLVIFYAVGHWNDYFNALIYISSRELKPVQIYLRDILVANASERNSTQAAIGSERTMISESLKYSAIILTMLPITIVYPFFQKYFVQGVMIGAVKS